MRISNPIASLATVRMCIMSMMHSDPHRKLARHARSPFLIVSVCSMLLLCLPNAQAGQFVVGRYAGEFMSLGAGARALAMGGAALANPTPATAGYYTPSRLAGLNYNDIEFMHANLIDNLYTYDELSYARPMSDGTAGSLSILYTRVGDIPLTKLADPNRPLTDENRVLVDSKSSDNELAVLGSMGRMVWTNWRAGASAKILYKSVAGESAYGLGFDVGMGRTVSKSLEVGVAAHDLTTSILAWSTGRTEAILPSIVLGGAYQIDLHAVNAHVTVVADLNGHFESRGDAEQIAAGPLSVNPQAGLEYLISTAVSLRGGYDGQNLTAGAGLHISVVNVDAAFQNHPDLGFTHRVSLGVHW